MTRKPATESPETGIETGSESPAAQMAHLMGEMTEAALAGQAAGLKLLAAEMQALSHMLPTMAGGTEAAAPAGEAATKPEGPTDAEIEAGFDNMPI